MPIAGAAPRWAEATTSFLESSTSNALHVAHASPSQSAAKRTSKHRVMTAISPVHAPEIKASDVSRLIGTGTTSPVQTTTSSRYQPSKPLLLRSTESKWNRMRMPEPTNADRSTATERHSLLVGSASNTPPDLLPATTRNGPPFSETSTVTWS